MAPPRCPGAARTGTEFPWGRVVDEEYLRYEVHDERPAEASARGEARTEIHLPGRLLIASSTLDLAGDAAALRYRFRRELRCNGELDPGAELGPPVPARRLVTSQRRW